MSAALWLAGCLLALFGASGLGRTLHFAVVDHARCEHGDYVHPGERSGRGDDATTEKAVRAARNLGVRAGHGEGDSHDHCDSVAVQPADLPSVGAAVSVGQLTWSLVAERMTARGERQPIALLARAPKSSPPRG